MDVMLRNKVIELNTDHYWKQIATQCQLVYILATHDATWPDASAVVTECLTECVCLIWSTDSGKHVLILACQQRILAE